MRTPPEIKEAGMKDAQHEVILHITKADVKGAKPKDPGSCAAARAVRRQLGACNVQVMRSTTYINHGTDIKPKWLRYATPQALTREIVAIDRGGRFEPGDFILKPFNPGRKLGAKTWHARGDKTGQKAKVRPRHFTLNIREV